MNSLILQTAARYLIPLLIVFSIFTLFRGHDLPGGGFAAGLLAATAFALYAFAYGSRVARRALRSTPHRVAGFGLVLALASGVPGVLAGKPYLTGAWLESEVVEWLGFSIGTPIIFDIGVYFVVVGASLTIILSLTTEEEASRE